ncbi:hypothetical protein Trydic_g9324 [Trypoxylus dichotomus]
MCIRELQCRDSSYTGSVKMRGGLWKERTREWSEGNEDLDTTLEFLQPFKPHFIELIDSEYPISQENLEDYLQEELRHCTLEEEGILDMKYKEDVVNYWKSGNEKRLSVSESMQRGFRMNEERTEGSDERKPEEDKRRKRIEINGDISSSKKGLSRVV